MVDNGDYILPGLTREWALALLPARGETYSPAQARLSLLLDLDASVRDGDRINSQRGYGRIWGWSHKKIRLAWDDLWQDVARSASSCGRQLYGSKPSPSIAKLPADWLDWLHGQYPEPTVVVPGAKIGPYEAQNAGAHQGHSQGHSEGTGRGTKNGLHDGENQDPGHSEGTPRAQRGAQRGHTTSHPTSSIPHLDDDGDRARGHGEGAGGHDQPEPRPLWDGAVEPFDPERFGDDGETYRRPIEAALALDDQARVRWACNVLRAGQLPAADRLRDLGERAARHGPEVLIVALAKTDHGATSRSYGPRLRFLDSALETTAHDAHRTTHAPAGNADDGPGRRSTVRPRQPEKRGAWGPGFDV